MSQSKYYKLSKNFKYDPTLTVPSLSSLSFSLVPIRDPKLPVLPLSSFFYSVLPFVSSVSVSPSFSRLGLRVPTCPTDPTLLSRYRSHSRSTDTSHHSVHLGYGPVSDHYQLKSWYYLCWGRDQPSDSPNSFTFVNPYLNFCFPFLFFSRTLF